MFEKIEAKSRIPGKIKIYKTGQLYLAKIICNEAGMKQGQRFDFYFDKDTNRIALKRNATGHTKLSAWSQMSKGKIMSISGICNAVKIARPQVISEYLAKYDGFCLMFPVKIDL